MSFELFAFRVAEPVGATGCDPGGVYNPGTQVSTWESDGTVLAITKAKCSKWYQAGVCCTHYSNYCNSYGCDDHGVPYICDNLG